MRKIDRKNKISFNVFGICTLFILGLFIFIAFQAVSAQEEVIDITKGSIIYDYENNYIDTASNGTITKKWNGQYYLKLENMGEYNLGKTSVIYDVNKNQMVLIGGGYQIYNDGSVTKLPSYHRIEDLNQKLIFKLADRKYLMIGNEITSDQADFNTTTYLQVNLDKNGNALLMNQQTNIKLIDPIVLVNGDIKFDVPNEKIMFSDKEPVDLKKINGSTNEYVEKKEEKPIEEETKTDKNEETTTQTPNNNNNQSSGNTGGNVVMGGSSGGSSNTQTPPSNTPDDDEDNEDDKDETLVNDHLTYMSLRGITPDITSIEVYYMIQDLNDRYHSVYLKIESETTETSTYELNKASTSIDIIGLKANTPYQVSLGCKYYAIVNGQQKEVEQIVDTMNVQTKHISSKLSINKIANGQVYFNFKMESNYTFDSAKINLYRNDEKTSLSSINVDVLLATKENGWSASLPLNAFLDGDTIVLRLENVNYNGEEIDYSISQKTLNTETSIGKNLFELFLDLFK